MGIYITSDRGLPRYLAKDSTTAIYIYIYLYTNFSKTAEMDLLEYIYGQNETAPQSPISAMTIVGTRARAL